MKRYTASQLARLKTGETRLIGGGATVLHLDIKLFTKHDGEEYRWSLIRERDAVRLHRKDGHKWRLVWPPSVTRMIEPMEAAARQARKRGAHVVALLLFHALIEALLRADPHESCRASDSFWGAARAYRRRLIRNGWSEKKAARLLLRLDELNLLRNKAIHEYLPRDGYDATNLKIGRSALYKWVKLYADMLAETIDELPL